jgi:hypothetical protein
MKTIEVSDEMHEFLMNLSKELNTQDHRSTAMPYFFQIQTQEKVPAAEGNGTEAWMYDGSMIETEEEITQAIAEYKGLEIEDVTKDSYEREQVLEEAGYRKVYYEMQDKYQNAFLTSKACDEHIRANKHHYKNPVNYLNHSFRNPEMEKLLTFLCGLTGKEIHK